MPQARVTTAAGRAALLVGLRVGRVRLKPYPTLHLFYFRLQTGSEGVRSLAAGEDDDSGWAGRFAGWLTATYAARQSAAADKCGVAPGEAWRAALAAADACGAAQARVFIQPWSHEYPMRRDASREKRQTMRHASFP